MAKDEIDPETGAPVGIPDPDNVPVRVVDGIGLMQTINAASIAVTLVTARLKTTSDGKIAPDLVVAARLRFDMKMARALRDTLNEHLAPFEKPVGTKPN